MFTTDIGTWSTVASRLNLFGNHGPYGKHSPIGCGSGLGVSADAVSDRLREERMGGAMVGIENVRASRRAWK